MRRSTPVSDADLEAPGLATSHALWRRADGAGALSLQDISEIQLLLRGQSVVD